MNALQLIDILFPEHDRTSCSDSNLSNSYCLNEDGTMSLDHRCSRCAALEIARSGKYPIDQKIYLASYNINE